MSNTILQHANFPEFKDFTKIPRLSRDMIITEKIDGENAFIQVSDDGTQMWAGSRNQFLVPGGPGPKGFYAWVEQHQEELLTLGPGQHFGEWWGSGIGRGYGFKKGEKFFSLFNTSRWSDDADRHPSWQGMGPRPACCLVTPVLYKGFFDTAVIDKALFQLQAHGSYAAPGFTRPEGVVIFHVAGNLLFKKTIEKDGSPKSVVASTMVEIS